MAFTQLRLMHLFFLCLCLKQSAMHSMEGQYVPIHESFVHTNRPSIVIDAEEDIRYKQKLSRNKNRERLVIQSTNAENIPLYEESFAQAPSKMKYLVYAILNKEEIAREYRYMLLAGPTGSGKSTLAEAFAYKLNKKFCVISAPSLLAHYRDQATENLRALFKKLRKIKEKPVLILDEMNVLTDDHNSEHADTKHTATQLWTLLDRFEKDPDFLFIGTTNVTKKMPHQLQSRFGGRTFFIDNPPLAACAKAIEFCFKKHHMVKDETCTDSYLAELTQKIVKFSRRDIDRFIVSSLLLFCIDNPNAPVKKASKHYLDQAYVDFVKEGEKLWDFTEQMTAEERRHKEALAQNKAQFEESKRVQERLVASQMIFQQRQSYTASVNLPIIGVHGPIAGQSSTQIKQFVSDTVAGKEEVQEVQAEEKKEQKTQAETDNAADQNYVRKSFYDKIRELFYTDSQGEKQETVREFRNPANQIYFIRFMRNIADLDEKQKESLLSPD